MGLICLHSYESACVCVDSRGAISYVFCFTEEIEQGSGCCEFELKFSFT